MAASTNEESNLDYPNESFFKKALESGLKIKDVEIESFDIAKGTAPGDNYSSVITRATVAYKTNNGPSQRISLILKSIPNTAARSPIFDLDIPMKEKYFYENFIPKMEALFPATKFAAKLFYSITEPVFTMVFEDLKTQGFILGKRQQGLNQSECKVVLERLGKYHAASMYLMEQNPSSVQSNRFRYGIFTPQNIDEPILKIFFIDSLRTAIDIVGSWKGYSKYTEKMKKIYLNIKERLLETVKPVDGELKVILHGDLWVNNLMFKYKSEDLSIAEDVRFVDFQTYYAISLGMDINYFFGSSVQVDVLENREVLVDYYYNSFRSSLEYLEYKNIPTRDQIDAEIRRKAFYSFITAVSVLPVICISEEDSKDCSLELFTDEDAAEKKRLRACQSKRYENIMKCILKYVDDLGGLD